MTERPIIFSAPMVRAILSGTKTQTRRVVKNKPYTGEPAKCPYGQPGDQLWVRETCRAFASNGGPYSVLYTADAADRPINGDQHANWAALHSYDGGLGKQVPSIHMPRWASRITLEVTGVRVERLQDISEADAQAEGCTAKLAEESPALDGSRHEYRDLWESINGPGSWDSNPWVWVVEFTRHNAI